MKIVRTGFMLGLLPFFAVSAQAPAGWVPVGTASVSDMSANASGALWAVSLDPRTSADKPILKWSGTQFVAQPVSAKRIAVDPQGNPWIVTSAGALSHLTPARVDAPLKAIDVAVGANGAVWAISTDSRIHRLRNGAWEPISGAAVRIAVDPQGNPWVVNAGGQIWRFIGSQWQLLEGSAHDISISSDGSVFIVSTKNIVGGYEIRQWNGKGWNTIAGAGGSVIAAGQKLYIALHGENGSPVYATSYQPIGTSTTTAAAPTPITLGSTTISVAPPATGSVTIAPSAPISIAPTPVIQPPTSTPPTGVAIVPPPATSVPVVINNQPTTSIPVGGTITPGTPTGPSTTPGVVVTGMMRPLAAPQPGVLACPIIVYPQKLEKGCALYGDKAALVAAKAPSSTCAIGEFADPQNGGECWVCPATYVRHVTAVYAKDACWKPIGENLAKATRVGKLGCNAGFFTDPRNGGECWSCPAGFNRTLDPVTAPRACSQGIFGPFSTATFGGKVVQACTAPAFGDPIDGGTCWTCPAGYRRTLNAVTSNGACAQTYETQYATATQKSGCSMFPTPVGYGTPFRDPRNGGECWACPVPLVRSTSPVTSERTGAFAASTAGGNTDRLVWISPQYPEPGADRFMPGLIQMALANPKVVDGFLSQRAGGDPAKKRALWTAMIEDPASSAELKALMFASLLTAARQPNPDLLARQSLLAFEEYARARRVFVAQEAVRMYDAWQIIDGYNQVYEARRASGIMGVSSSVLGAASTDYQEYAWTAAAPDSAGVEFVAASALLSTIDATLPPSTFNNNNPSFQLTYLQPVSFALGSALETMAERAGQSMNRATSLSKALAGGLRQLGANAFFVVLTLVNAGIEIGTGINILVDKDKLAGEYAKLVTDAQAPVSVRAMLESKDEADARALMLFWALATSPYSTNARLSQGKISGAMLCNADDWTAATCADAKARVMAAAKAAGY